MEAQILIVEDDVLMADTLDSMVRLIGYRTVIAGSAQDALSVVAAEKPGLALLDVNLPDFDGFELCTRLRADPMLGDIPVIFISIENDPDLMKYAAQFGAVQYLVKPVGLDDLERAILDGFREQVG